jgi:DNA-binding PadR family transcriptional regulator
LTFTERPAAEARAARFSYGLDETMATTISATEAALLGLLAGRELSGYDLQREAEKSGGFFWAPTKSRIYAVLPQLVERGYATSRSVVQANRPNKQLYRATRAGRAALQEWLEEPPVFEPERAPILLKLYLGELLEPDVLLEHVRKVKSEAQALRLRLEAQPPAETVYAELTVRHGLEWARAMIRWASGAEKELEARLSAPVH